ncbi:myb-binding protein 1A [Spea bombifrons]|uniref:myb-binding protein 1A n=1 Tax=Spea bombifrons TaxID=233779 RepID=UPI00234AAA1A|nr:myb-binding protein 1A [Spea bombifrons]
MSSMAEDGSSCMDTEEQTVEAAPKPTPSAGVRGVLQQNREFLDFFWDIAKPDQGVRLAATENLIKYLKSSEKEDELHYALKRLVEGLAATREAARPGFSLALAQVLQNFEDITLFSVLEQIRLKHNPANIKKKLVRNACFGSFFGVLALFQSGRLVKDPTVLLHCVQLLQSLAQYKEHLKELPTKTLVDILTEVPESTFEEVLFKVLRTDLACAFNTPEQLHLLLVGMQMFPGVLKPAKLKKLLGSSRITTEENIPKLVDLLKTAARSVKKEQCLPGVAMDLMRMAFKEEAFELFWKEAVENGLLKDQSGPCNYMCYRLLGASLPHLDAEQLQMVLRSEVMLLYGSHVVSTQPSDRFKFAPEMETYVDAFLKECQDPEKQSAVLIGFTLLTNQGYPVIPSTWNVIKHLKPPALQTYIDWLKNMFTQPDLKACLDFSTKRQKENQEQQKSTDHYVFRLRKWIIPRLTSIVDNALVKRTEEQVMDIARFVLFHAFFNAKKPVSDISETKPTLTVPLDDKIQALVSDAFFSLLFNLNCMAVIGDSDAANAARQKHLVGITADGVLWIECMVRYANTLLSRGKVVTAVTPFTKDQKEAWDRMLQYVDDLKKKIKDDTSMQTSAYQQLMLLVGIHLFKTPDESIDLLNDIQCCLNKAQNKKPKKLKNKEDEQEPEWVEVMVEILLSLFSQPSRLFRLVAKNVFKKICPYVTKNALQLILDVLDSEEDNEEGAVVVTDEKENKKSLDDQEDDDKSSSDEDSEDEASGEEGKDTDNEEDNVTEDVNEAFRKQLMNVLQTGKALETEESDEDLDDEAMMALDENLSALFAEQKQRIQAKKDEKAKIRKEKILRKDFKTKVLDLIEVFIKKQPQSPLVFSIIEPLISVIQQSMNSTTSTQQEQDYLRKTADIFMNDIMKAKRYCKNVSELKEDLHAMMERLVTGACKQNDSSVALYYFSASLYLMKVLKNSPTDQSEQEKTTKDGCLDVPRVTLLYKEALKSFMTKRKSPLTGSMFAEFFERFPFMCDSLLDIILKSVTEAARQHQQGEACALLQKVLHNGSVRHAMSPSQWQGYVQESINQVMKTLQGMNEIKVKADQEKQIKCFDLLNLLIKTIKNQNLDISLTELSTFFESMTQHEGFGLSTCQRLKDMYWNVMKLLGVPYSKPQKRKNMEEMPQNNNPPKKKKGFLPETKKRKNRKKTPTQEEKPSAPAAPAENGDRPKRKRKRNKRKPGQQQTSDGATPSMKHKSTEKAKGGKAIKKK